MKSVLSDAEIEAAAETMGIDETLITDGTYFIILAENTCVACGGWGKRRTLYGRTGAPTHDDTFLDPKHDAARIRAMYTHPDFTRRGLGAYLLKLAEGKAATAGFKHMQLGSTVAGQAFYLRNGYEPFETRNVQSGNGQIKTTILMKKPLRA